MSYKNPRPDPLSATPAQRHCAQTMPFGRYKGKPVSEVPKDYFRWLHGQGSLYDPLLAAVEHALGLAPAPPRQPTLWQPDPNPDNTITFGSFDENNPEASQKLGTEEVLPPPDEEFLERIRSLARG